MEIEFLMLANSRKSPGRCVAGINLSTGEYVRFVSNEEGDALDWRIFQDANPGSVFSVNARCKAPTIGAQTENWVIDHLTPIKLLREEQGLDWIKRYSKSGKGPFGDPFSYYFSDRYKEKKNSLCVVTAYRLDLYPDPDDPESGKGWNRIDFDIYYPGNSSIPKRIKGVSVTDPHYSSSGIGQHRMNVSEHKFIGKAYLVLSLPSVPSKKGFYQKFVTTIIQAD